MEKMNYFIFYKEDDNFSEILQDKNLKKLTKFKIKFRQHLILGSEDIADDLKSYILLKFGDDLKDRSYFCPDRKPVPFVDYLPDSNRPEKFKKL
jgi:hypothetical protein